MQCMRAHSCCRRPDEPCVGKRGGGSLLESLHNAHGAAPTLLRHCPNTATKQHTVVRIQLNMSYIGRRCRRLQAGVPCSFVTGWTSSSLPRRGYSPRCCRSTSPATFLYGQVVQCPTHVQHVRRQKLCRSRDSCVEQSAVESTRRKTQFSELRAPAENSLVYC